MAPTNLFKIERRYQGVLVTVRALYDEHRDVWRLVCRRNGRIFDVLDSVDVMRDAQEQINLALQARGDDRH